MPTTSPDSTAHAHPPAPRSRPWWRFRLSLRGLMVLVLVIGAPLGWKARRASIQRRAVAEIQALGGRASFDYQLDARGQPNSTWQPWWPGWLGRWVGDEFFREVVWVHFEAERASCRVDDESLAVINQFDRLQGLTIFGKGHPIGEPPTRTITEAGLARLQGLNYLRSLTLHRIGCTDAMVALLPHLPNLERLSVIDFPGTIRGSSLAHLAQLPRLRQIEVFAIESSNAGDLAPLTSLNQLEQLRLTRSPTSDPGVGALSALPSLQIITLPNTACTAASLADLCRNPELKGLSFDGSRLTRGGFDSLARLRHLTSLAVYLDDKAGESNVQHLIHRVGKRFGDADLDSLKDVPLRELTIMGLDATDTGVGRLLQSHTFTSLALSGRGITDASIPLLAQQTQLNVLALADTSITDAGLAQLAAIPRLQYLSLVDNAVLTDAGLAPLQTFPALTYLTYRQPAVRPATIDSIRAARVKLGPFSVFQPPEEAPH